MEPVEIFNWSNVHFDKSYMDGRLISTISALGWQRTIIRILRQGIPFPDLKVVEVGCGSGTFALSLSLLGAKVTLVDADEQAIAAARKAFDLYGQKAEYVIANVLESVPERLLSRFHLSCSGGLAEHFAGDNRLKCVRYHKELLCPGGFSRIGVPNRFSPFYQMVRLFRIATKTWGLDVEIPYSAMELKRLALRAGFSRAEIIGNYPMIKDAKDYSAGLAAAVLLACPWLKRSLKRNKREGEKRFPTTSNSVDIMAHLNAALEKARVIRQNPYRRSLKDFASAGLVLYGDR